MKDSNRTFMELKYAFAKFDFLITVTPIAPLWNWNYDARTHKAYTRTTPIAPLWNWNKVLPCFTIFSYNSNRTFMELKYIIGFLLAVLFIGLQSHLYGIEIIKRPSLGRVQRKLQSHLYGIEMFETAPNHFFAYKLQSHLYGIEIAKHRTNSPTLPKLQSHLYGIEIYKK